MVDVDLRHLIYKDLTMTGATIVEPGTMARLVTLIERGIIKPNLPSATLYMNCIRRKTFMKKSHSGNIVVDCRNL